MQFRAVLTIFALCLVEATASFEATMIYAALPTLIRIFGDPLKAGWLVTVHLLVGAGSGLVAARMGDLRGRKKVMLVLLSVAALGSLISAVGSAFWVVLVGRAMQGMIGAMLPLGIGVVRETLPDEKVPMGVGFIVTASSVGSASGIVVGGAIIDNFYWQWLFAASALMLGLALTAVWSFVPRSAGSAPDQRIDWIDGFLPVSGITALVLAISLSKTWGWADPAVAALTAAGFAILVLWAWRNLRARFPLISLRLLFERNVAVANAVSILMALGTYHVMLFFSPLMQAPKWTIAGLGLSATMAGLVKLPSNFLSLTAGPFAGWLASRFTNRAALTIGAGFAFAGWSLTALMPDSIIEIIGLLCLISFGTTVMMTGCLNLVASSVPRESTSEAIASITVLRAMFMAVGSQLIAVILSSETISQPGSTANYPAVGAYQAVLGWIAATVVGGLVVGLMSRPIRRAPDAGSQSGGAMGSSTPSTRAAP